MYLWRTLNEEQRELVLRMREQRGHPPHHPQHIDSGTAHYLITAACYEHRSHIGYSASRMTNFTSQWLHCLAEHSEAIPAWIVLPNHYHALVRTSSVLPLLAALGRLHGRTSFQWNKAEGAQGRKVWYHALETVMKSDGHFHATINYVLNNAVKHGHAEKWTDWPWCNASEVLEGWGRSAAVQHWKDYPVDRYGEGWDDMLE